MSNHYQPISWNKQKIYYDLVLWTIILSYLAVFSVLMLFFFPNATIETTLIRALGSAALILLHLILSIGPLCRLNPQFLPLLYNRRHMGVSMFFLALAHGIFTIIQFHSRGNMNPVWSVFLSNTHYGDLRQFPFQPLGFLALIILLLMAVTSHDLWLAKMTAPVWKSLHMFVYLAYALIVAHVCFGTLQREINPLFAALIALGFCWVIGIHLCVAFKERKIDKSTGFEKAKDGYLKVCRADDIPDKRGKVISLAHERAAVFKYDGKVSAVSNVCQHQGGPLGEGKIIKCKIVCPWHGYEYFPEDGQSPPPFTEKIETYHVRVENGYVYINPVANPRGTRVQAASL